MIKCLKISKLAILIASCNFVTACGGGGDKNLSAQNKNSYAYKDLPV